MSTAGLLAVRKHKFGDRESILMYVSHWLAKNSEQLSYGMELHSYRLVK